MLPTVPEVKILQAVVSDTMGDFAASSETVLY